MKRLDMADYNRAAKTYWIVMVIAGTAVSIWALVGCLRLSAYQWIEVSGLLALVVLAGLYPIRIPNTNSSFTVGDTFTFLAVLFLGVPAAILIGAVDSFVSSRRTSERLVSWIGSPSMMALTVFISGHTFYLALNFFSPETKHPLGTAPVSIDHLLASLTLLTLAQYVVNGFSISTIYALKTKSPILRFWRDGYLWTWWSFLASAIATTVIYTAISLLDWTYMLLSVPVVAATFWTYKIYFERVNIKTREAEELSRLHLATVEALATAIDAKDQTTHCHVRRVQIYARGLGQLANVSQLELAALQAGALLHDVGKLAVPDHILNKPGALTPAEFEKTKIHTVVGAEILSRVNFPYPVVPIVRHHHERWDGHGYPDGLKGEEIPITARIMSVIDCFDSAREARPFRTSIDRDAAIQLLRNGSGTSFDPRLVDVFIDNLPAFEAEIERGGLDESIHVSSSCDPIVPAIEQPLRMQENKSFSAYNQIRNAHREVFALYEIARTFGSSLEVENTLSVLIEKVGNLVPFDTCVVFLYDEAKGYARAALAVGLNADVMRERCVAPGEGITGFALANRRPLNRIHPSLDFTDPRLALDQDYCSMAALPLFKDDLLLGALCVYSSGLKEYNDDQIRLLETVTRLASDALANAVHHARANSNALTDPLTGLPNARSLHLRFEEEVARARRTGKPFQVIMLDLDDFKLVNDTFGHKLGDRMLREVATLVHEQLREYDFLARYAGDEFVALVPDMSFELVEDLHQRIEKTVSDFVINVRSQGRARVGISVGSAVFGIDGETLDQLLIAADQAMYRVKSRHKTNLFGAANLEPASSKKTNDTTPPGPLLTPSIY